MSMALGLGCLPILGFLIFLMGFPWLVSLLI